MREISYENDGRWYRVRLPDTVPDSDAIYGIVVGPPDITSLGLPTDVATRLHNQLYSRHLFTLKEATSRSNELFAAWQAALRVNVQQLLNLYTESTDGR